MASIAEGKGNGLEDMVTSKPIIRNWARITQRIAREPSAILFRGLGCRSMALPATEALDYDCKTSWEREIFTEVMW
jgi:hypothetical protein